MQMNKKTWEMLGAILIVIALIVLIVWLVGRKATETQEPDISDTVPMVEFPTEIDLSGPVEYRPNPVARAFVERFGSFSSESGYQNIEDVMVLATTSLQSRLQSIADEARTSIESSYYGVTTKVVAMEIVEETENSASLLVTTQRNESIDSPANTTIEYQEIDLDMVRQGDTWLVSDFQWR